jgi:hypothetical protein
MMSLLTHPRLTPVLQAQEKKVEWIHVTVRHAKTGKTLVSKDMEIESKIEVLKDDLRVLFDLSSGGNEESSVVLRVEDPSSKHKTKKGGEPGQLRNQASRTGAFWSKQLTFGKRQRSVKLDEDDIAASFHQHVPDEDTLSAAWETSPEV